MSTATCPVCSAEPERREENLAPWQVQYLDRIMASSNEDLLDDVVYNLCGDTDEDCWRFHVRENELRRRLADWLKEER